MEIVWTKLALEKILSIAEYISRDNYERANSFAKELFERSDQLVNHPESGNIVREFQNQNIRELLHGFYRIIYEIKASENIIYIRNIVHSRQSMPSIDNLKSGID